MALEIRGQRCPDCGTPLTNESWARGMCLSCLARLAIEQPSLHDGLLGQHDGTEAATLDDDSSLLRPGQILGERAIASAPASAGAAWARSGVPST